MNQTLQSRIYRRLGVVFYLTVFYCLNFTNGATKSISQLDAHLAMISESELEEFKEEVTLAFNAPFSLKLENLQQWDIVSKNDGSAFNQGVGSILEFVFAKPGDFILTVHGEKNVSEDDCNHDKDDKVYLIHVSPNALVFDFNSVQISPELVGGVNKSYTIKVEADFNNYHNLSISFSGALRAAGIGAEMQGELKGGSKELVPGKNLLEFQVSGSCKTGTYIMFDFIDINGNIQCYYFPNKIK